MVTNKRIVFLKQSNEKDAYGQGKPVWEETSYTGLAKISEVSGRLYYEAARANEENTILFRVNRSFIPEDLNKIDYRIKCENTIYTIKHISGLKERFLEVQIRGISI